MTNPTRALENPAKTAQKVMAHLGDRTSKRVWQYLYFKRVASTEETATVVGLTPLETYERLNALVECGLAAKSGAGDATRYSARMPNSALSIWKCC